MKVNLVYMQGLVLRSILPQWGVVFLPLDIGSEVAQTWKQNPHTSWLWTEHDKSDIGRKWSCDDYDTEAVGKLFLGGLGFVLDKWSNI